MARSKSNGRGSQQSTQGFLFIVAIIFLSAYSTVDDSSSGDVVVDTCTDGIDNDSDGLLDGDDGECQDPNDGVEDTNDSPTPP